MRAIILILAGSFVFITGCTASGPAFSPVEITDANKAIVYIYRPSNFIGGGSNPPVYVDEIKQGRLQNNGYLVYSIKPGKRMIGIEDLTPEPLTIYPDFIAGKEYYIRLSFKTEFTKVVTMFEVVPKECAIQEIKLTKKAE
jgi:Protein of unknown function (DUF2846)